MYHFCSVLSNIQFRPPKKHAILPHKRIQLVIRGSTLFSELCEAQPPSKGPLLSSSFLSLLQIPGSPLEVSMGRSDGQRGIDTKGRRRRGKEGCSPRYLFLSCLRFKRRATLHVQLTGCLPARFSRDSIVLCQAWRALCATWAGGDPQMCTKPLRFPLTLALFLEMRKCRVARLHRQQFYV